MGAAIEFGRIGERDDGRGFGVLSKEEEDVKGSWVFSGELVVGYLLSVFGYWVYVAIVCLC